MRARRRNVTGIVGGVVLISVLAGCAAQTLEDEQAELTHMGYDVHVVDAKARQHMFRTTIKGCTVDLFISQDKELWAALVMPNGQNVYDIIQPAGTKAELQANSRFIALCP